MSMHHSHRSACSPVIQPTRRVPLALQDKLKLELDEMESQEIICKITEQTEWVSSVVVVRTQWQVTSLIDPKDKSGYS